jgi:serine/threonine-protein kinase
LANLKRSKYRILGLIGQGQFGRVYCALHRKTGRLVALKSLDQDRFPTHKFLRELRFLLSLQHPNIVSCAAIEHIQGGRYLVMDYCMGGTLRTLMELHDRLHPALSVRLVADVLAGIDHAHQRGIVHCDIKPENILLEIHPQGWTAKLTDFGIARLSQELMPEGVNVTGSPAYMAPERFYGQYSASTDLYAIGILLFELLVGYRPFSGRPMELMSAHLNQPVRVPDCVPVELQTIILTALQKLKARRFHSASEMLGALQCAIEECPELDWALWVAKPLVPESQPPIQMLREEILRHPVDRLASLPPLPLPDDWQHRYLRPAALLVLTETLPRFCSLHRRRYTDGLLSASRKRGEELPVQPLPEPLEHLIVRSQHCYGLAERSLYLLSEQAPKLLTRFHQPTQMAIAPSGRWMAVATVTAQQTMGTFSIWHLPAARLTQPPQVLAETAGHFLQLVALDQRHIAAFSQLPQATQLRLFNRRGQMIGELLLPVQVERAIALTQPYQFAAIEPQFPKSLLLLHLKPLKIVRVILPIAPQFLAAFPWGVVAVDRSGQLVMLDEQGQILVEDEVPGSICAIAAVGSAEIAIATWQEHQGKLYMLKLPNLNR